MKLMETKDIVYAVGIGLTFILGIWNLINNYLQTKKLISLTQLQSNALNGVSRYVKIYQTFVG